MNTSLYPPLAIPLEPDAHHYAAQFAAGQASSFKGKRVYLNTLAVYAVRTYLNWLSIPNALHQSDCWHAGLQAIFDVADLVLPDTGRLECRPILPGDTKLVLPPPAGDRLAYVAVELNADLNQAKLLGFLPAAAVANGVEAIALTQLQPMEALMNVLYPLQPVVNLRLWLEKIFQQDWQLPARVMSTAFRGSATVDFAANPPRNTVSRGRVVRFEGSNQAIALVLQLTSHPTEEYDIRLRVFPTGQSALLPRGLQLLLLDADSTVCAEALSHEGNDWIELEFGLAAGEQFSLQLTLDEQVVTKTFQV